MPNFCSTLHDLHHHVHHLHHQRNKYEPSKMFGLINCEHKGYVGFEFDDYPDDILIHDVGKCPSTIPNSHNGNYMMLYNVFEVDSND